MEEKKVLQELLVPLDSEHLMGLGHSSSKTPIQSFPVKYCFAFHRINFLTGHATEIYPVGYVYTTLQNGRKEILSYGVNTHVSNYKLSKIENPADRIFGYKKNKPR